MSEEGDGDRILTLVGVGLVAFLVVAMGVLVLAGMFGQGNEPSEFVPQANWSAERVNDTHIRLVHQGGDAVQTDNLIVVVGKVDRGIRRSKLLERGEGLAVPAAPGENVALYWKPRDPKRRVLLARWEGL